MRCCHYHHYHDRGVGTSVVEKHNDPYPHHGMLHKIGTGGENVNLFFFRAHVPYFFFIVIVITY